LVIIGSSQSSARSTQMTSTSVKQQIESASAASCHQGATASQGLIPWDPLAARGSGIGLAQLIITIAIAWSTPTNPLSAVSDQ
jgi:hypothetical protein